MNTHLSPLTFQFHDIATARITTDNQTAHNFFKTEYYYHLKESAPEIGNNLLLNSLEEKKLPFLDIQFAKKNCLLRAIHITRIRFLRDGHTNLKSHKDI